MKKFLIGLAWVLGLGIAPVLAAGIYAAFPPLQPAGTTGTVTIQAAAGSGQAGQTLPQGSYAALPLTGNEDAAFDTNLGSGQAPQTETVTVKQLKLFATPPVALTDVANTASTCAVGLATDASLSDLYTLTLSVANTCLGTPTNLVAGKVFRIIVTQDGTGSRNLDAPLGGIWKFNGGFTSPLGLSTTAGAIDIISAVYNGTSILADTKLNFK